MTRVSATRTLLALAFVLPAGLAQAEETVPSRTVTAGEGSVSIERSLAGPEGGAGTLSRECTVIGPNRCSVNRSLTSAEGQSVTRERTTLRGPHRTWSAGTLTGPEGQQVPFRNRWRR